MNTLTLILSALLTLTLIVLVAPNILALNRGKILRNIAVWVAIFLALALLYRSFGPGSPNPLFSLPPAMEQPSAPDAAPPTDKDKDDNAAKPGENSGYNPPSE